MFGTTSAEIGISSPFDVLRLMITLFKHQGSGCIELKEARLMCSELHSTTSNWQANFSVRNDRRDASSNNMWASACILPFITVAIAVFSNHTVFQVRCDGANVLRDAVVSVPVIELEGDWLWLLDLIPELVDGEGLELVKAEL